MNLKTYFVSMNMVEEQDHPMNHRLREENMNMVEHYHPMNHRSEVEDMDMDIEHSDMEDDMMVEVEVVEREH
jgi:hypothetical protein